MYVNVAQEEHHRGKLQHLFFITDDSSSKLEVQLRNCKCGVF